METVNFILHFLALIFFSLVFTKIFMRIANFIGEQLGLGKFFMCLLKKISKNND